MTITHAAITGTGTVVEGSTYTANLSATSSNGPGAITGWSIDWGDGSTGAYPGDATSATHLYANDTPAPKPISGTVSDSASSGGTGSSLTTTSSVTVTEAAPTFLAWVPGTNFEGDTVSLSHSFVDPGGDAITGYSIDWNDGTVNSSFTHTYPEESTSAGYRIRVTATTTDSGTYSTVTTGAYAHIGDAALSASGVNGLASAGVAFTGKVATFTDSNTGGTTGDFSASINWGDNTAATAGTVTSSGSGGWNVGGTHTYTNAGTYTEIVTITDVGGASNSVAPTFAATDVASITAANSLGANTVAVDGNNLADVYIHGFDSNGNPTSMATDQVSIVSMVPAAGGAAVAGVAINGQNPIAGGVDKVGVTFPATLPAGNYTLKFSLDNNPKVTCTIAVTK